jgi:hypothetical protein
VVTNAAVAIDAGDLPLGGGLLALLRPALDALEPGGVVALTSSEKSVAEDLPSWCRVERHVYLGREPVPGGDRHLVERGRLPGPRGGGPGPLPAIADPASGFAPRGARVEPGGPRYPFKLLERDRVAPPEIEKLYQQATAGQWDAARDIPWAAIRPLPPALDGAVAQVFTFLAENELSALYVPSRFLPLIHPAYAEVAMTLAVQLADEARHIDGFLRRARACRVPGVSSATTSRSLLTLLESPDFTEATFLLSVLGEGTFLDLLRFVEAHAPDDATGELARRARVDEARHVHFGLAHVRHGLATDPELYGRLEAAVRRRSAALGADQVPAPLADALTVLAAGGVEPRAVRRGHDAYRELLHTMHENRMRRLSHAGFDAAQAQTLSDLHTPNFM